MSDPSTQKQELERREALVRAERRAISKRIEELDDNQKLAHAREFEGIAEKHMRRCAVASFVVIALTIFDSASGDGLRVGSFVIDAKNLSLVVAALGMIAIYSMQRYWLHMTRSEALYPLDILTFKKIAPGPDLGLSNMSAVLAMFGGVVARIAFLAVFGYALIFSMPSIVSVAGSIYERSGTATLVDAIAKRSDTLGEKP